MGNVSAKRKAKKEKKLKDEAIAREISKKKHGKIIILVLGQASSGKSTIIQQIIQHSVDDINDTIQTCYKLKSFNINETAYSKAHNHSATSYQYLNEVYNKLNVMHVSAGGLWDTTEIQKDPEKEIENIAENLNSKNINNELLISGYIHETEKIIFQLNNNPIPIDIYKLLINYCPNETVESHIIQIAQHNYVFELWEINEFDKKIWNELYQYARTILFVVDVSVYNEFVTVDGLKINKLSHSLNLFQEVVNDIMTQSNGNSDQTLNLFFNKYDIFKEKIQKESISKCPLIQEIRACDNDEDYPIAVMEAIQQAFRDKMNQRFQEKEYYMHVTNATDRENINKVFNDVVLITINSTLARGS